MLEAFPVERVPDFRDESRIHASRVEISHLVEKRPIHHVSAGVQSHTVQAFAERTGDLERGLHAVVVEIHQRNDLHVLGEVPRQRLGRLDRVAPVSGDQGMGHRPDSLRAPPRRLGVRRHADRSRHMGGPPIPSLYHPVVVASGKE